MRYAYGFNMKSLIYDYIGELDETINEQIKLPTIFRLGLQQLYVP
jgi:hypothetical protein